MPVRNTAFRYRVDRGDIRWMDHAACTASGVDFYPDSTAADVVKAPKAVCATCPVERTCLEYALRNDEKHGIWGGTTPTERDRIRLQAEAPGRTAPTHCRNGHELTPDNLRWVISKGRHRWRCRICTDAIKRRSKTKAATGG